MPKKKKKLKVTGFQKYLIAVLSAAILILFLLIIFKTPITNWLLNFFITYEAEQIQNGEPRQNIIEKIFSPSKPISPISPIRPIGQTPLQGSFTELFSGVGWRNPINSTVHQDFKTLTISFPPAFEISPISPVGPINSIASGDTITVGSRIFRSEVKKAGEQYEGYLYEVIGDELVLISPIGPIGPISPIFSSQYPGKIVLASDGASKLFLLYAAYQGNAFEIRVDPPASISRDYSSIFNARVTEEGKIDPQVFYKDGTWWIFSKNETPKLLRIRDGMANDLTEDIRSQTAPNGTPNGAKITAAPAPEANTIYISVDSRAFLLRDLGFRADSRISSRRFASWESLRLNPWEGEVVRGRFTRIDAGSDGGSIKYYLSNDGGKNWEEAELNQFVQFSKEGGDFRFKAELYPSSNQHESPWVKTIGVEYYIVRH